MQTGMNVSELHRKLRDDLAAANIETPEREARLVIQYACGIDASAFIAHPDAPLTHDQVHAANNMAAQRLTGRPLSRILGYREFYGLRFNLSGDTLDPRPDTEILVDAAIKWLDEHPAARRVLDLGTGTGCIPISILANVPDARAVAVDVADGAVAAATANAALNGVSDRMTVIKSNWTDALDGQVFDLICSNPPYIPSRDILSLEDSVQNHDPILALDGGADGYDAYRHLFMAIKSHLAPGGIALFEIGAGQLADLRRLSMKSGLDVVSTLMDYGGIPRVVGVCVRP